MLEMRKGVQVWVCGLCGALHASLPPAVLLEVEELILELSASGSRKSCQPAEQLASKRLGFFRTTVVQGLTYQSFGSCRGLVQAAIP